MATIKTLIEGYRKDYRNGTISKDDFVAYAEEILLDAYEAGHIPAKSFWQLFGKYCAD